MIRFGPAGNSESFYAQGFKASWQAPAWLRKMGLSAYEYSFGRGVNLSEEAADESRLREAIAATGNSCTDITAEPYEKRGWFRR